MDASSFQQGINIDFSFEVLKACDKQPKSFRTIKMIISQTLGWVDRHATNFYCYTVNFPKKWHMKLYKIWEKHISHT